jgi:hypothetical protein
MSTQPIPKADVTAENFPALRAFLRGYFHEDMADEYGSTDEAARQFCEDADSDERGAVAGEWSRFLAVSKDQPLPAINQLLKKLGSSSRFKSPEELDRVSEIFRSFGPKARAR